MSEEPQDQIEEGEDVEKLLDEFGSLYSALAKHQRPMAVLFTDLKGSTAIFGERSDIEGLLFLQRSESLIRPAVDRHAGTVVKTIGDAVMASFSSADDSVNAAVDIQHALEEHNAGVDDDDKLSVRIGVNTGKGFVKDQDIFGQVVNIAAKVQAAAEGDQILVSQATVEALSPELTQRAAPLGPLEVPGVTQPIEVFEILWQPEGAAPHRQPLRGLPREAAEEPRLLVLECSLEADRLKVGANERSPGEAQPLEHYEEVAYPGERIEALLADFTRLLNQANRTGSLGEDLVRELEGLGQQLFDALLPLPVKERLRRTPVEDLIVHIDDKLVQIPWELIFDGERFLSKRFNMGRVVRTRQAIAGASPRPRQPPLKMLILANPKGDLDASAKEAATLRDALATSGAAVTVELLSNEVTVEEATAHLNDYDIVHFAGHAQYHIDAPETSAWLFHDGELTASAIPTLAENQPVPTLVFSNACQSGYTEEWKVSEHLGQETFGLANAFLLAGVQHYIGTFWEIPDAPSAQFALAFYSNLIKGASVGQALREARQTLTERFGDESVIWASYMLYGDPTACMFRPKRVARPTPARAPEAARAPREEPVAVEAEPTAEPKEVKRSGIGLGAAAAVGALLLVGGGFYMMSGSSTKGSQAPSTKEAPPSATSAKATTPSTALVAKRTPLTSAQVQRVLNTSKNFDLQNLSGLNLQSIDMTEASFKGSDLSGANLSGARLERANLAEAILRRANLAKADLRGADLTGANLAEANLADVQLWGSTLVGADLRGANMAGANFPHASLKGADLSKADLRGANFFEADLEGARFTGANIGDVQNIWRAKNAEKAIDLKLD